MNLAPEDVERLDTVDQHPEIAALAKSAPADLDVANAAQALARRLVGMPSDDPGPLVGLLTIIAGKELALIEEQCHMQPARAVIAAVSLIKALLERYLTEPEAKEQTRHHAGAASLPEDTHEKDMDALRASLAALAGRKLPEKFPLPNLPARHRHREPTRLAAALADHLKVEDAASTAWAALSCFEDAMAALAMLVPGLGWDFSTGALAQTLMHDLHRLAALLERLSVLRRIVDELGRMEAHTRTSLTMEHGGREDVVGVRVGGELADVLPCELALLGQPQTEDLFYQRFLEHRLLCLELQGTATSSEAAPDRRGPIVACVDTSGSMQGAPEAVAKALILAVIRQARPERRPVRLILFGGPGEFTELDIRHQRGELETLLSFLSMGFHAGTDFDGPLLHALDLLDDHDYDKADILVITDGLCRASCKLVDRVQKVKQARACRIVSVVVAGDTSSVDAFSDRVWEVDPASPIQGNLDVRRWVAA